MDLRKINVRSRVFRDVLTISFDSIETKDMEVMMHQIVEKVDYELDRNRMPSSAQYRPNESILVIVNNRIEPNGSVSSISNYQDYMQEQISRDRMRDAMMQMDCKAIPQEILEASNTYIKKNRELLLLI